MKKEYIVNLTKEERSFLKELITHGEGKARTMTRARILLKADVSSGKHLNDAQIADAVEVSRPTVERIRKKFVKYGMDSTLYHNTPSRLHRRKVDGELEAKIIALACSTPETQDRWTLRLLADKAVELGYVESISHQRIHTLLKKMNLDLT